MSFSHPNVARLASLPGVHGELLARGLAEGLGPLGLARVLLPLEGLVALPSGGGSVIFF